MARRDGFEVSADWGRGRSFEGRRGQAVAGGAPRHCFVHDGLTFVHDDRDACLLLAEGSEERHRAQSSKSARVTFDKKRAKNEGIPSKNTIIGYD